ncbi:hypothetical protein MMMDOFMJ_2605 [Methylobacterium gnaphalii]|nr:hypothetical protein MMMDOFMJ_2605 [Methylobacterium gnaphalii]
MAPALSRNDCWTALESGPPAVTVQNGASRATSEPARGRSRVKSGQSSGGTEA